MCRYEMCFLFLWYCEEEGWCLLSTHTNHHKLLKLILTHSVNFPTPGVCYLYCQNNFQ